MQLTCGKATRVNPLYSHFHNDTILQAIADSTALPPPNLEDETVLPLPVAISISLFIGHPDDCIRPLIASPFAHFLFRTSLKPPLSDPLSPSSSLPYVRMHLRVCLKHCTASASALLSILF